jgi:hypothetical protein
MPADNFSWRMTVLLLDVHEETNATEKFPGALGVFDGQPVPATRPTAAARPNIVLMFPDNLGWGEVNVYGGVRGPITPRLDRLAAEGLRLNNFNVEFSCTVSRAALLTGRYAIRTGATQGAGITLWEVTIAEALQSIGYATGLFGKWHLGGDRPETRNPSQQLFDEYYGIPRTSNEAQTTIAQGQTAKNTSFVWEGRTGSPPRNVKPFDLETRRTIDRESAEKAIAFMERSCTTSTLKYPHVPPNAPDPYQPPRMWPRLTMPRFLLAALYLTAASAGVPAQPPADFSGQWTLEAPAIASTEAVPGRPAVAAAPGSMGSGWGLTIAIAQDANALRVEYTIFSRYDLQPPLTFTYPLDGSEGRNTVMMGRGEQVESSRARWDGRSLVIVTTYQVADRAAGKPFTAEVTRRLSLESPTTLIVDATRTGVLGGPASTTRSVYRKW